MFSLLSTYSNTGAYDLNAINRRSVEILADGFKALQAKRPHHHAKFGMSDEGVARGELGNTFAVLGNTTLCTLWLTYHIFLDEKVLADVRSELKALVYKEYDKDAVVHCVDLAAIRTCPILMGTFQEVMRFRAVNPGPRVLLEDVYLDDRYSLKKGMIPAPVQHSDAAAWGDDVYKFDHLRFARKSRTGQKKPNRVAFRAFGSGHILCPGRHFASTELMVLQFDVFARRRKVDRANLRQFTCSDRISHPRQGHRD
ncbi:cytochrome P450 [Phaeosphaeriaceae sp. PMI808]|nr:cytochrome P450 [Phaeosphaeriaceae sp. PMI808]